MSSHSFGMGVHKLIGTLTILLLLAHILSHRRWYRGAFRGKGNFRLILNLLMLLALAGILLSGGMLAKDIGSGLGDTMTAGRLLHNISSYVFLHRNCHPHWIPFQSGKQMLMIRKGSRAPLFRRRLGKNNLVFAPEW